ncbi:MAG: ABC transporter ATP-binding protein [Magnetococcales bacterium]|nr:ABC transporter ATP-binding protein [Magnetococcales bacterium]
MIEIEQLTRRYGDFTAVDGVSFHIGKGSVVGLLGHNGAGKTTIMKMMTGFLEPTSGTIRIDGLQVGPDTQKIQKRIGYLPENCPLWTEMTVMDYLDFMGVMRGMGEQERPKAIKRAIERTVLMEKALDPIATLSRGYRQRVGVAQAILHTPQIVILDEPTNGLDPTQIRQMRTLIRELAQEATVIISTHILQEVQAVCERVLILRSGRLALDTRLDEMQKGHTILVTLDRESEGLLTEIPGVASVAIQDQDSPSQRFTYRLQASRESAPAIASAVAQAGLKLYALQPERHDLERLFAQVNETEEAGEVGHE